MKSVTITAENKDGVKLGSRDVDMPETIEELQDQFEDKDIVKLALRSWVIDVQREIRTEATGGKKESDAVKAFKKLSPEKQAEMLAKLAG
jgi:hypothetical protein